MKKLVLIPFHKYIYYKTLDNKDKETSSLKHNEHEFMKNSTADNQNKEDIIQFNKDKLSSYISNSALLPNFDEEIIGKK